MTNLSSLFIDIRLHKKRKALTAATILLILSLPTLCQATSPFNVVISELAWMGSKIDNVEPKHWWRYEWLELYNNTSQDILLDGWRIELYRTELDYSIELKGNIAPAKLFTVVSSEKIFPNFSQNYSNLSGKFFNEGQKVLLKNPQGEIIDSIDCSLGWFAGDNTTKQTMERKNLLGSGSDKDCWTTSEFANGTPGKIMGSTNGSSEKIIAPIPPAETKNTVYDLGVFINEILPSPQGPDEKNEWIEIYNGGELKANLSGWQIADIVGTTKIYKFPEETELGANDFIILKRPETKIILNNENDGLIFTQPDGNVVQKISYEKAPLNKSYNRFGDNWVWSEILTPGIANSRPNTNQAAEAAKPEEGNNSSSYSIISNRANDGKIFLAQAEGVVKENKNPPPVFLVGLLLALLSVGMVLTLKRVATK